MSDTLTSAQSPLGSVIDSTTSSIHYLRPSDNPGVLITSVLLRGDNYTKWTTEFSNSIQAKQRLGFINRTIAKPTTEPDLSRWMATNSMLVGWIRTKEHYVV